MTFSKDLRGDALRTHLAAGEVGDLGGAYHVSRPHKLSSGTRFLWEYKQVLNPYGFNNKHVYGGAFHTLLVEVYPSTSMIDIPVSS